MNPAVIGIGLMLMSFSSGCVDILSYRFLGQVFTSAMTGNVALMGLDLGQGNMTAASRNLTAFVCFLTGLTLGVLLLRESGDRPALLRAVVAEIVLLAAFSWVWRHNGGGSLLYPLIGISALAMGIQSAVAQRMAVPGISTTYFTGTLTSIVFGVVGRSPAPPVHPLRRVRWPFLAFVTYVVGAVLGGWITTGPAPEVLLLPMLPTAAIAGLLVILWRERGS
ncbi:MAG: DUF1275 domain-containing protein [Acetobacteraceae bacterium]|nr:DUF1275 domain-containing protein [Acetobacteraceae bacterium]